MSETTTVPKPVPLAITDAVAATRLTKCLGINVRLTESDKVIREVEGLINDLKVKLKAEESTREGIVRELRNAVEGNDATLFDGLAKAPAVAQEDEAWKSVTMKSLGIKGKLLATLEEKNLATMGLMAAFTADGWSRLTDIPGVGDGNTQKITDAMDKYWEANPRKQEVKASVAPKPDVKIRVLPESQTDFDMNEVMDCVSVPGLAQFLQGDKAPIVETVINAKNGASYARMDGERDKLIRLVRVATKGDWDRAYGGKLENATDTLSGGAVLLKDGGEKAIVCPATQDVYLHFPKAQA